MRTGIPWPVVAMLCLAAGLAHGAMLGDDDTLLGELIDKGKGFYNRGKLKESLETFREVIELDGDNVVANHYMARVHARLGEYKPAIDFVRRLQRLGVSIYRSPDSKDTLNTVMGGILGCEDLSQRAELLIHLRETIQGLPRTVEQRIDAHLMAIYAKLGETQLHKVVHDRFFPEQKADPSVYFTAARVYLEYDVSLPEAASYLERCIDGLKVKEIPPSGNPRTDEYRRKLLDAEITVAEDFLAYTYRTAGFLTPERNRFLAEEAPPKVTFADVTEAAGLQGVAGPRVAVGDYDGDGFEDLCITGRIFKNQAGRRFTEVTEEAKVSPQGVVAALWLDYDGDGRLDLLCSAFPTLRLWRNRGDGTFEDVTRRVGLAVALPGVAEGMCAADYDGDGRLDLFVGCFEHPQRPAVGLPDFLLRGTPEGRFQDASEEAGLRIKTKVKNPRTGEEEERPVFHCTRGCAWGDVNNDGRPDLYVANYRLHPNQLWVNQGRGKFVEQAEALGVRGVPGEGRFAEAFGHSIGCTWGDLNGDGALDLVVTNLAMPKFLTFSDVSAVYLGGGEGANWRFADVATKAGIRYESMVADASLADFDNDGDLDLYLTAIYKERPTFLYENDGNAAFQRVTWRSGTLAFNTWGQAWFDKDNDGDLDLVLGGAAGVHLFENQAKRTTWARVQLLGKGGNRQGIGARVSLSAGRRTMIREVTCGGGSTSQSSPIAHFGLGGYMGSVDVAVRWPDGRTQRVSGARPNTLIKVEEQ